MKIISVPTEKFRRQNPIFHLFYAEMSSQGVEARDFDIKTLFDRDLKIFQVHFPEHFAMNYGPVSAVLRSSALLAAMVICKLRGVPTVWTVHNIEPFERRNMLICRALMLAFVRLVDGCVFLSHSSQQQFQRAFPRARPRLTALIPHPAYPVRTRPAPMGETVILGMIGEQKAYKQPLRSLRLFQAARRLAKAKLLIAGHVHDSETLRGALEALPEADVSWTDRRLEDEELSQAAGEVNLVLLPYAMITNSGAAIFALSCERAIVTSPLPLFYELREMFGPQWVRIADGSENESPFWRKPDAADHEALRRKLDGISLRATAERHIEFFRRLHDRAPVSRKRAGQTPRDGEASLKKRRPAT